MSNPGTTSHPYSWDILSGLFGSGHASWAPSTFTVRPGNQYGNFYSSSMTVTVPNDDANWTQITDGLTMYGYTNVLPIALGGMGSSDVSGWDNSGMSITLLSGTSPIVTAFDFASFLLTPTLGEVITIAPQRLVFALIQ